MLKIITKSNLKEDKIQVRCDFKNTNFLEIGQTIVDLLYKLQEIGMSEKDIKGFLKEIKTLNESEEE